MVMNQLYELVMLSLDCLQAMKTLARIALVLETPDFWLSEDHLDACDGIGHSTYMDNL